MELTNQFEVAVPVEEAWAVLTDVEKIAPCLPGAELQEVEGDEYRGVVKVKVGPITASYRGSARFEELDPVAHRGVLKADGRETRGQGNASATITATLSPSGTGTKVEVVTDLSITGKVAQFGRGVLADVSGKLLDQFVQNLETMVLSPTAEASPAVAGGEADSKPSGAAASNGAAKPASDGKPKAVAASADAQDHRRAHTHARDEGHDKVQGSGSPEGRRRAEENRRAQVRRRSRRRRRRRRAGRARADRPSDPIQAG
jgi:hypothetical protein